MSNVASGHNVVTLPADTDGARNIEKRMRTVSDTDTDKGKILTSFGAKEKLTPTEIETLREISGWTDIAAGRLAKRQIQKLLGRVDKK